MREIFTILLTLFLFTSVFSQEKITIYKVMSYAIGDENYDEVALDNDVALSFFELEDGSLGFANIWREGDSMSYGSVHSFKYREIPETDTTHAAAEAKFTWSFENTYDEVKGMAAVTFTTVFVTSNTTTFFAEIVVLNTNEVISLQGYLEE